ncbi:MAG: dTDP-4-dehydrorhamnose 3,5-epimerase [Planctomycetes bacterium]|nr:dTDP-4-dehydrorhamnose 3,5-epimerase [Planctomycetota bacterium]
MEISGTTIRGLLVLASRVVEDGRGYFMETYRKNELREAGIEANFVQENQSGSRRGVLRGLHFQIQKPQGKLIRVVQGEVFDAAVDLRRSSPTFGKWFGAVLSAANKTQLWIPPGCAHGFYVLSDWADVVYKVTEHWSPEHERTLLWNDSEVGVAWPLAAGQTPILSSKDAAGTQWCDAAIYD